MDAIGEAVEAGDLDELTRFVDRLCSARDWDDLVDLRDRCRAALARGKQLWPVASHAEYRLALEAPGEHAARALVDGTGHLAPGPLPEVAASSHRWSELAPHLEPAPLTAVVAHECVVRGSDELGGVEVAYSDVLSVPLSRQPWEPDYPVAVYRPEGGDFPSPDVPRGREVEISAPPDPLPEDEAVRSLLAVVRGWTATSEGSARAVAVVGRAEEALAALQPKGPVRGARLAPGEALAWLCWAGASGGHHGRRRGSASGRDLTWSAIAAIGGLGLDEAPDADELAEVLDDLGFLWWSGADAPSGWVLRLAIEDRTEGIAWAIDAVDPA